MNQQAIPEQKILGKITKAIDTELESLQHFRENLHSEGFTKAVNCIYQSQGKVIVTGVGKSGDIAKKISSTLSSTGTPSSFLHPTDAVHGDAGIIQRQDVVIAIGKSGESDELLSLLPTIQKLGAQTIAITANPKSRLAQQADILLLTPVLKEACPLALAPTSSTTIALVAGDAIAMALMEIRQFQAEDFALYHPSGRLGKRLSLEVKDVMRQGDELAKVNNNARLAEIINEISNKYLGATAVIDAESNLLGFITDHDIRKKLQSESLSNTLSAHEIMNPKPITVKSSEKAYDVLLKMEARERPISVVPVLDSQKKLVGILSLHDMLQLGLK
ncbi:MAG: KpsF/GutQ family sugar-phosphate isomerase [Spirochaetota bacterium]